MSEGRLMEPRRVLLTVVDSARPPTQGFIPVEALGQGRRVGRGLARWLLVTVVGVGVTLLPLVHLCGAATVLLAAPVAAFLAYRTQVLLGAGLLPCPKCEALVAVAAGTTGWPARLHCGACGSTLQARPEPA
jgi:hypothetical protein